MNMTVRSKFTHCRGSEVNMGCRSGRGHGHVGQVLEGVLRSFDHSTTIGAWSLARTYDQVGDLERVLVGVVRTRSSMNWKAVAGLA